MKVSILLTSYNHFPYLKLAVESIRAQTFTDYEILSLDDGSTDGSREWLLEQPDIRCCFTPHNIGTYAALNHGAREACGENLAIFNDDDLWSPSKLEKQVAQLDAHPELAMNHTFGHFIDAEGNEVDGAPMGFHYAKHSETISPSLESLVHHNSIITSSAMLRRSSFEQLNGFDEAFFGCGDWNLWLKIARLTASGGGGSIGYIPEDLTQYRIHSTNSSRFSEKMFEDSKRLRTWIAGWQDLDPKLQAHNLAALGTEQLWLGEIREGRASLKQAIQKNPARWQSYLRYLASFLPVKAFRRLTP